MDNDIESLMKRAEIIRRRLQILKEQAAVYPIGSVPAHLLIQIEETEKELEEIEDKIRTLENKKISKNRLHQIEVSREEAREQKTMIRRLKEKELGAREVNKTTTVLFTVSISIIAAIILNVATANGLYAIYVFIATLTFCGFTFGVFTRIMVDKDGKITIERRTKQD